MIPLDVDAGQAGLWRSFARQRRTRSQIMLGLMAGFRSVYAQNDPLLQWARNVGVGWLNRTPAIKRQLMKEALGLGPLAQRL
jgi:2-polyprenyl-6-methoxyphenol hydroxylase-like FAD-dependent oxidoreductase